ncbi:T9SS type A sorting domain-containing protein [bacterium]|nr:T9SS type A sorting domain-containing protein [bacterium]
MGDAPPAAVCRLAAHPNPFNPCTAISFVLDRERDVALSVVDLGGRLIRSRAAGSRTAGTHRVTWDGCDAAGRKVPSGVYFARLRAGAAIESGKLVLVR